MKTVAIKASSRSEVRSKGAKAVRADGKIPAVVYGGDSVEHISVEFNEVRHVIYTPEFKLVNLDLDGTEVTCIIKEIQFHPVTEDIVHIDFLRLVPGRAVKVSVPIRFEGVAPGLRAGGTLNQKIRRVSIKTTPENLVDELVLDVSQLKLGQSVRVKDAQVGEGIEVLTNANNPVATVQVPRVLKSIDEELAEAAEAAEEEGVEGEGGEGAEGAAAEGDNASE